MSEKKKDVVYIGTMESYTAIRKDEILHFSTMWMGTGGHYVKLIKLQGKEKLPHNLTYIQYRDKIGSSAGTRQLVTLHAVDP